MELENSPQHCGVLRMSGSQLEIGINDCICMLSWTPMFVMYQELNHSYGAFLDNHDFSNQNSLESIYLESHETDIYEIILAKFPMIFCIIWGVALRGNFENQNFSKIVLSYHKTMFIYFASIFFFWNFWFLEFSYSAPYQMMRKIIKNLAKIIS